MSWIGFRAWAAICRVKDVAVMVVHYTDVAARDVLEATQSDLGVCHNS